MKKFQFYIITIGCQMNKSDSERLVGNFLSRGWLEAKTRAAADLVALVTCGVRQVSEDRIYGLVPRIKQENKKAKILLTGCLAYRNDIKKRLAGKIDYWLAVNEIFNFQFPIFKQFSPHKPGQAISKFKNSNSNYLCQLAVNSSKISAFVPVGNGCNNFCSYCVVPYARGRETYRPAEEIVAEVKDLVKRGYKEIVLLAQNVNSYKVESKKLKVKSIDFPGLLKIINGIPGEFWVRFMTSHPKDASADLIKIVARGEKICAHLHLPIQAGDDKILQAMNRRYTVADYIALIKKVRRADPDISISTDIIVGFPGETKAQFNNTVKLFKAVKFDMAFVNKYSPRPGTAAAKLKDDVPIAEKKRREVVLMKILRKTAEEYNKKNIGKEVLVLVSTSGKQGEYFGLTSTNKYIKIKTPTDCKNLIGKFVKVKITKAHDFGLDGQIVSSI